MQKILLESYFFSKKLQKIRFSLVFLSSKNDLKKIAAER